MTGYGLALKKGNGLEVEVALRSVNGRYLEIRTHLPREYLVFESQLKKKIQKVFRRGTVDLYIQRRFERDKSSSKNLVLNTQVALNWKKNLEKLAKQAQLSKNTEMNIQFLSSLPGVLEVSEDRAISAEEKKILFMATDKAILACDGERGREGEALKKIIKRFIMDLEDLSVQMGALKDSVSQKLKQNFETKMDQLHIKNLDPQRLAQEVSLLLDRLDISEELDRLAEHLKNYQKMLGVREESQGKKMDFYCQELLREVNTMGSKSQHSEMTKKVVDAKAKIEKLREQVQNIE